MGSTKVTKWLVIEVQPGSQSRANVQRGSLETCEIPKSPQLTTGRTTGRTSSRLTVGSAWLLQERMPGKQEVVLKAKETELTGRIREVLAPSQYRQKAGKSIPGKPVSREGDKVPGYGTVIGKHGKDTEPYGSVNETATDSNAGHSVYVAKP